MAGVISQNRERGQFLFCLIKNPLLYRFGSAEERSDVRERCLIAPLARTSERAAPSACPGKRFSGPQIVWNRSTRRAGARGGARVGRPRWLRILSITGGSSMAAIIFKAPPQLGQCSMSMSKTRLSSLVPTYARRRTLRFRVIAYGLGCRLRWSGNDFTTQLRVGRQHTMEAACPEPVERDPM